MRKTLIASTAGLVLLAALPSAAQDLVDGSAVHAVLGIARDYGSAIIETHIDGNPKISGRIDGIPYAVRFASCVEGSGCAHLNFHAGFTGVSPTLERINEWNAGKRFGRAFLDAAVEPRIEMDVNIGGGVTAGNLGATFALWRLVLNQYAAFIGFR